MSSVREVIRTGKTLEAVEPVIRADCSSGHYLVYKFPLPGKGHPRLTGGVAVDVTEQRRTQSALQSSQQRLQHVLSSSPAILYTLTVADNQVGGSVGSAITSRRSSATRSRMHPIRTGGLGRFIRRIARK